jgi:hypothetical protein
MIKTWRLAWRINVSIKTWKSVGGDEMGGGNIWTFSL